MEFIKDKLYINRNLQPAIITLIDNSSDYPICIKLLNKVDCERSLTKDGYYMYKSMKSQNDLITDIPLYEYKNEHIINDIFYLSTYNTRRISYPHDNGISYDNKNCVINILSTYQTKNIREKLERLQYCIRSHR